ncbi:MAG: hypothetical protein AN484_12040, partial [Aphanizomenon flos-aquae WA102]
MNLRSASSSVITRVHVEPLPRSHDGVRHGHHIVWVVDALQVALAVHRNALHLGARLNAKLRRDLAGQVVGERPQVPWREQDVRGQVRRLRQLLHTDEVPLQQPRRARVDEDVNVRVRHVDEHDLREGRGHGLDRDAVVLLLVDQLD